MSERRFVVWHRIDCEFGSGMWSVSDGMLTVTCPHGTKSAQLTGNNTAPILARLLMYEMTHERQEVA